MTLSIASLTEENQELKARIAELEKQLDMCENFRMFAVDRANKMQESMAKAEVEIIRLKTLLVETGLVFVEE